MEFKKELKERKNFMFSRFSECYSGSCTPAVLNSTYLPSQGSYDYLVQSRQALLSTTGAPDSEILLRIMG